MKGGNRFKNNLARPTREGDNYDMGKVYIKVEYEIKGICKCTNRVKYHKYGIDPSIIDALIMVYFRISTQLNISHLRNKISVNI